VSENFNAVLYSEIKKMKKIIISAVAALLVTGCLTANATVIVATNTATYEGVVDGTLNSHYLLNITYDVTLDSGIYTYNYLLATVPSEDLYSFTLGGAPDPIDTQTMAIVNYGGASITASGISNDSVGWLWGFNSGVTSADVSYTSTIGPGTATFTLNDDDITWSSPSPLPAPVPEPSSLAIMAASVAGLGFLKYRRAAKSA
jgi:hypothetical protein